MAPYCQNVRSFLKSYAGIQSTFNSFRTHVEPLLLWALIVARKLLPDLRRFNAEQFMEFCLNPPADWDGPMISQGPRCHVQRVSLLVERLLLNGAERIRIRAKISVRDEYVARYLVRYRYFLKLSPLPSPRNKYH